MFGVWFKHISNSSLPLSLPRRQWLVLYNYDSVKKRSRLLVACESSFPSSSFLAVSVRLFVNCTSLSWVQWALTQGRPPPVYSRDGTRSANVLRATIRLAGSSAYLLEHHSEARAPIGAVPATIAKQNNFLEHFCLSLCSIVSKYFWFYRSFCSWENHSW